MTIRRYLTVILFPIVTLQSCERERRVPLGFELLPPGRTGVSFANTITTDDSVNVQTDSFVYNGGGVAIGDIDNDGLADLFFTGNMVSSRLYLNRGDFRFEDITESAGVGTERWATGASMVDIDNNGFLDIYVSVSGPEWTPPDQRRNLLFLNNGDRTFTEAASAYRLDDASFTTHAVFFDYDLDGHLDLYLLNNSPADFARGEAERHPVGARSESATSYDKLFRNRQDGTFEDVSLTAGILQEVGFGLGVVVTDINGDRWPDVYISNDDTPSDVLYVNDGDGTFTDRAAEWLKHTSFAGMGMDIADFNNDGWPDILQTDMMPDDLSARKRMAGATTYSSFMSMRRRGFHYDYNLNTLQLNGGVTPDGHLIFSEIARMAGVAYTDWSWSALFGDYDNDGHKDILITNGYPKAVIDYDYQMEMFAVRRAGNDQRALDILENLHSYQASNYIFRNNRDLTFTDETAAWGMQRPSFSYGAGHADLDNDGRLDVVINNIDAPAFVYRGIPPVGDTTHYLQIELRGETPNSRGIGARLKLTAAGQTQFVYHTPYRGFMSSMDDRIHLGLGDAQRVDSIEVVWPDGGVQVLTDLPVDRVVTVRQGDANVTSKRDGATGGGERRFQRAEDGVLAYAHVEKAFVDYTVQPLLPQMMSRQGPPVAVGDVTRDGLDDVYVGGAAGFPGVLFIQQRNGRFTASNQRQPWIEDRDYEDWGAVFFDADGNGTLDLYVASGGYHVSPVSDLLQDRLYLNQGNGRFVRDMDALQKLTTSTGAVAAGDFTGDGRTDLFVGGRLVPRDYPSPTRSYLLRNDGGRFTDVTEEAAAELVRTGGMVTDAVWVDFTGDGQPDLVTAGEWMPVQFYANAGGRFRNVTSSLVQPGMRGWWYSLATGDFNEDGRPDIIAGNLGLNHAFRTSNESRFGVYAADFTGNQTRDIVFTQEVDGIEYPFFGLARLGSEIYPVGLKFTTFASFATAPVRDMFTTSELAAAIHYQADTFASVSFLSQPDGSYGVHSLPNLAQISPINAILTHDVDGDGNLDLIVAGNQYYSDPNVARSDAGNGLWLRGDGRGRFIPVMPTTSGFFAPLHVTDLGLVGTTTGTSVIVANNSDSLQMFTMR